MLYLIPNYILKRIYYILFILSLLVFNIPTLVVWVSLLPIREDKRKDIVYRYHIRTIEFVYSIFFTFEIINEDHYKNIFFKQRYLICPNHQTEDMHLFQLGIYENKIQYVTPVHSMFDKYVPIIGWIWRIFGHIFVSSYDNTLTNISTKYLFDNTNKSLVLFPEAKKQFSLKFNENVKDCVFEISINTNIPILPVYHNMGTGVNNQYIYLNYGSHIKIYIGDQIYPKEKTVEQLKEEYVNQMKKIENNYFNFILIT